MKIILCSLFMVVTATAGPLVNTTMNLVRPIGETFSTIALTTTPTPQNSLEDKSLGEAQLPIFSPGIETTYEGVLFPEQRQTVEEVELPEDTLTPILNGILPFQMAIFFTKLVTFAVATIAVIFLGKAITGALSHFFSGLKSAKTDDAIDRVRRAVEILQQGINKYDGIQGLGKLYSNFLE